MDGLDLSGLTDDQLIDLARACCVEAIRRNPEVESAMRDMMLTEAEKVRIARMSTDAEMAAARARERERIAMEAIERVRAQERAEQAARAAAQADQAAERARAAAASRLRIEIDLLDAAASLVDRHRPGISILHVQTSRGRMVYINEGGYRYTREHLVAFNASDGSISTVAALVKSKPALIEYCARVVAAVPLGAFLDGSTYRSQS